MASCHNYRHHRHVARVLLAAGRVGDDELALVGGEEAVGDVDGDALLALGFEAVDEEGEVDVLTRGAVLLGVALHGRELILEDQLGLEQQATDQRRLAVVHRAAGDEAQERLLFLALEVFGEGFGGEIFRDGGLLH